MRPQCPRCKYAKEIHVVGSGRGEGEDASSVEYECASCKERWVEEKSINLKMPEYPIVTEETCPCCKGTGKRTVVDRGPFAEPEFD